MVITQVVGTLSDTFLLNSYFRAGCLSGSGVIDYARVRDHGMQRPSLVPSPWRPLFGLDV